VCDEKKTREEFVGTENILRAMDPLAASGPGSRLYIYRFDRGRNHVILPLQLLGQLGSD
jgi:hypothetical protein